MGLSEQYEKIWASFLDAINEALQSSTQDTLGARLGVHKATITKWRKGTIASADLRDFLRYADTLDIDLSAIAGKSATPACNELDVAIATTLKETADVLGVAPASISATSEGLLSQTQVTALLTGERPITASEFSILCQAIGITPERILQRAEERLGKGQVEQHTA